MNSQTVDLGRTVTPRPRHRGRRLGGAVGKVAWKAFKWSLAVALLLGVWEVLPRIGVINEGFMPPFPKVASTWWELITNGTLGPQIEASVKRALEGLVVSIAIGVPLGFLMGWYRPVSEFLTPVLEIFRNTAPIALLPVFILFLGIGEVSKVAVIVYACVWPVLLNTISGVHDVDPLLIKSGRSLGLNSFQIFTRIVTPAATPTIFAGIRLAGTFSILMVILAEQVGAISGLGYYVNYAEQASLIPQMYAAIVTITLVGLAFNIGLILLERRILSWRPTRGT
jgi:NitT/TauT family transport system permease protein